MDNGVSENVLEKLGCRPYPTSMPPTSSYLLLRARDTLNDDEWKQVGRAFSGTTVSVTYAHAFGLWDKTVDMKFDKDQ